MIDDAFSIDSLLNDLNDIVGEESVDKFKTIKFKPHPPKERSPTQASLQNPKTKFAVGPDPSKTTSFGNEENSIDDLLSMLNSPPSASNDTDQKIRPFSPDFGLAKVESKSYSIGSTNLLPVVNSNNQNNSSTVVYKNINSNAESQIFNQSKEAMAPSLLSGHSNGVANSSTCKRCVRVALAGSKYSRGWKSSAFSKAVCNQLRCLSCNFRVVGFEGFGWDTSADYMFFRNNMPNETKLRQKLVQNADAFAYCCQCSWKSVENRDEEVHLSAVESQGVQWSCSGHMV